jgi:hypothetical protein
MKQTAVQWCVDKIDLLTHSYFLGAVKGTEYYNKLTDIVKEAMELEREQIINAHGNKKIMSRGVGNYLETYTGEQYYKETYENN